MRLLIFTQKVDKNDSILGFMHEWIRRISLECESVAVICLEAGESDLPNNVTVHPIGKGYGITRLKYIFGVYRYLFLIRGTYDKVFIHMNQEYVFSLGPYWRLVGIPVYMWRNHPIGNFLTDIAVAMSTKVFCTSTESYTARFKKTVIMPAGINTDIFRPVEGAVRKKYSVCMVGRIAPIKHNELALEAMNILLSKGVQVSLSLIGGISKDDIEFAESLKRYILDKKLSTTVHFVDAVPLHKLPEIYSSHEICLNLTEAGSFDKTIVEAAGCGAMPLVSNESFKHLLPEVCITDKNPVHIAEAIQKLLDPQVQIGIQKSLDSFVGSQSLGSLIKKLFSEINGSI